MLSNFFFFISNQFLGSYFTFYLEMYNIIYFINLLN